MKFSEALIQVREWLEREGRVSYRALKREFALDDEFIEDLKAELIDAKRLAADEDGKVLVWIGKEETAKGEAAKRSRPQKLLVLSFQAPVPNPQPLAPNPQPASGAS